MAAYLKVEDRLVTCPYDEAHRVKESRLQLHIAKCKLNHLDKEKEVCPFNATHILERSERDYHLMNCPDKAPLDRKLAQTLDKNNPFKGRTAVPHFSEVPQVSDAEVWDEDITQPVAGFQCPQPPRDAIIEPPPMSKPAQRRQLYRELHRMQTEPEKNEDSHQFSNVPSSIPRQPKQPSETQKLQNAQHQELNVQAIQNLGLGRGKSASRIAANIFYKEESGSSQSSNPTYSEVIKDMNNLGLGRGKSVNERKNRDPVVPLFNDDEDFPALGCGRGAMRTPKLNPRTPGAKPKN